MDAAGVSFPEAHLDPNAMAELTLAGHRVLGFAAVEKIQEIKWKSGLKRSKTP
jgi:uroporphyrinogen-III decarboxylase